MAKKEIVIITDYSHESLTLQELCESYHVSPDFIETLIEYEIIYPKQTPQTTWTFNMSELQRIQKALRLQHDLEVNVAGIAVVLDLLDELEELRAKVALVEKHYL